MTLFRTVDPAGEPVTLAEAKAFLRVAHASEDDFISGLIRAARHDVEVSAGIAMLDQTWRLALDGWPREDCVKLARHPVKAVLSVTLFGEDGEAQILDPATYRLDRYSRPARLFFRERPQIGRAANGVEIDFSAGFGEAGPDVPDALKHAMLLFVSHYYEKRAFPEEPVSWAIPPTYERLIASFKRRRL